MTMCAILKTVYGRDTRPAQWFNVIVSLLWVFMWGLNHTAMVDFKFPDNIGSVLNNIGSFFVLSLVFSLCNFVTIGKTHQFIKAFSFALGALANAVAANSYIQAYPPVDPMLFICLVFCLLFLGAVFYVLSCEGLNGVNTQ